MSLRAAAIADADGLRARVRERLGAAQLVTKGQRVLVGLSGGPDSVVLAHLLAGLRAELGLRVTAVHVDHQLRPSSGDDAAFVERLAQRLEMPVRIVRRDVRQEARRRRLSLEDGARRVRYDVFQTVAEAVGASRLALAHTADDQAETVLMRLMRGAGLTGLTAMSVARTMGTLTIIRPLLGVWRQDVLNYARAHRLAWCQDETNDDVRFLRNRVRRQLLPLLEQTYNPHIKFLLVQLAEQCQTDLGFLHQAAQRHWKRLIKTHGDGVLAIRIQGVLKQPKAVQRQLMRLAVQRLHGDLTGFEFRHWREIERLLTLRPAGAVLDLPGALQLERRQDIALLRVKAPAASLHLN